jgi:Mce-associated membrane protein
MTTLKEPTTRDEEIADIDEADEAKAAKPKGESTGKAKKARKRSATTDTHSDTTRSRRRIAWPRLLAFTVLPGLALVLALVVGYVKWLDRSNDLASARSESVRVASEDAVALLSYRAESVDRDLGAARERLTGDFKDAYTALTREVVIPGAKEKHISARAKVTAAASVSATDSHAVVLAFVDQTVTIGEAPPTDTTPVLRVTLDKVNGKWLVSHFDPV